MPSIFITGCATGFGARLATHYLAAGWHVIATDRSLDAIAPLHALPGAKDRLVTLQVDVCNLEHVQAAADQARALGPVDVLINNAGHAVFGTIEESDLTAVAHMFEVNVMGLARMTQALLPALRESSGTVVNLSSVAGRMSFPESGYYAATKHAVEAISDALYAEVAGFGMRVIVIEPGSFDTQFLPTADALSLPRNPNGPYAAHQPVWDAAKQAVLEPPQNPSMVVGAVVRAIARPFRFQRVEVGPDCIRILSVLEEIKPSSFTRLMAHQASGAPATESEGDPADPTAHLEAMTRPVRSVKPG
ncbi:MAG: NADP-dependent 3-hydroxy acid dehydrogenase YdfG [Myxococcota bacterium]|jgi:NADP-dependent 3-hydroxy acid dehydrogenase YdfG